MGIAKVLGLGVVGNAMAMAGFLMGVISDATGINPTFTWTQTWYYGEDNHMSIGWTRGSIKSGYFYA